MTATCPDCGHAVDEYAECACDDDGAPHVVLIRRALVATLAAQDSAALNGRRMDCLDAARKALHGALANAEAEDDAVDEVGGAP